MCLPKITSVKSLDLLSLCPLLCRINVSSGRGGLDEEEGEGPTTEDGVGRGNVSRVNADMHRPSDAEHALRLIAGQLRNMRHLSGEAGVVTQIMHHA